MDKVTKLRDDWTLIEETTNRETDTRTYRLAPPKWYARFYVSTWNEPYYLEVEIQRAADDLIRTILGNPSVKDVVDSMVSRARWEGYAGAYKEIRTGERYDFASTDHK